MCAVVRVRGCVCGTYFDGGVVDVGGDEGLGEVAYPALEDGGQDVHIVHTEQHVVVALVELRHELDDAVVVAGDAEHAHGLVAAVVDDGAPQLDQYPGHLQRGVALLLEGHDLLERGLEDAPPELVVGALVGLLLGLRHLDAVENRHAALSQTERTPRLLSLLLLLSVFLCNGTHRTHRTHRTRGRHSVFMSEESLGHKNNKAKTGDVPFFFFSFFSFLLALEEGEPSGGTGDEA